jgi:hypothetical protein
VARLHGSGDRAERLGELSFERLAPFGNLHLHEGPRRVRTGQSTEGRQQQLGGDDPHHEAEGEPGSEGGEDELARSEGHPGPLQFGLDAGHELEMLEAVLGEGHPPLEEQRPRLGHGFDRNILLPEGKIEDRSQVVVAFLGPLQEGGGGQSQASTDRQSSDEIGHGRGVPGTAARETS